MKENNMHESKIDVINHDKEKFEVESQVEIAIESQDESNNNCLGEKESKIIINAQKE